jgi:hypothetical protein
MLNTALLFNRRRLDHSQVLPAFAASSSTPIQATMTPSPFC